MTLYLKYRPQKISDLDIKTVRESLTKVLSGKNLPHAFLFNGPKGTGKTSAARIVAKYVNCEKNKANSLLQIADSQGKKAISHEPLASTIPCNTCESCLSITKGESLDVIEIDAASHRGIDDIRSLRETIKLAPFKSKYKVYIIDECHMLTTEASNALLKTLEEPPAHVIFILATTNPEKLIPTILSRCTVINFTKATIEEIIGKLELIAKSEKVDYEKDALSLIAQISDGAFRDAVKKLEQCIVEQIELTRESVENYLFHSKDFSPTKLITLVHTGNTKEAIELIEQSLVRGVSAKNMTEILLKFLRESLLAKVVGGNDILPDIGISEATKYIDSLIKANRDISVATIDQLPLEIFVINSTNPYEEPDPNKKEFSKEKTLLEKPESTKDSTTIEVKQPDNQKTSTCKTENTENVKEDKKVESDKKEAKAEIPYQEINLNGREPSQNEWQMILTKIRSVNSSTEALLRAAKPLSYDGHNLVLGVYYKFHKERLESTPHRDIVYEAVENTFGALEKVNCVLTDPPSNVMSHHVSPIPQVQTSMIGMGIAQTNVVLTEAKENDIVNAAKDLFGN